MFEDSCLTCGKHIDDGDECQQLDASPCISSASSALSSPHLGFAVGGDVPALVPSAIGAAFANYRSRDRQSVSSSASSTVWSVVTDDDEDDAAYGMGSDSGYSVDSGLEHSAKSASGLHNLPPPPLSYARRPASTNNSSAIPHLHRRTSSGSFSGHVRGAPRSAPLHYNSTVEDDDDSDFGSSYCDPVSLPQTAPGDKSTITKSRRSRNRASLPAYFSLLQVGSSGPSIEAQRSSLSLSVTSAQTVSATRPSPPTPKLAMTNPALHHPMQATPRGRKRDLAILRSSCLPQQDSSSSRSRSRSRLSPEAPPDPRYRSRLESSGSKNSVEQVFDWATVTDFPRGRAAVRRNSSPPPKMVSSMRAMEEFTSASPSYRRADSTSRQPRTRGRARVDELDGLGNSTEHPGYGHGRSGLLDRERVFTQRTTGRAFR
ncbi:hypothetical protein K435DRAFT_805718 [Dendrothele bispora CBS 962.96]|uniref:Uncharacterized protein n=1 Tax=Dendrothele bispora (strain CBS 962.96) TaxID=1314807 RepID=A0A4S8LA12_DENBC|nr:hypothetical protein K435DRAFT_805718 [Dendrothele bispora CBS 962.96]